MTANNSKPNPNIVEAFDSTHIKGLSEAKPPVKGVDFYTDRDPVLISEEETWEIKIPKQIPRCHSLRRAASPGITGAWIARATSPGVNG